VAEKTLSDVLSKETLASATFGESFGRGKRYLEQGRVKALKESEGVITARVRGADWYDVELHVKSGELRGACSCPVGSDGLFCKHCVATGLAWLVRQALDANERTGSGSPQAVRDYLAGLHKDKLVDLVMAQAQTDAALRQRLTLAVARSRPAGPDLDAIEAAIVEATRAGEPWSQLRDRHQVKKLEAVLDILKELLDAGQAAAVVRLAAQGLERSAEVAGRLYDPGNDLSAVVGKFLSLHLRACAAAKPDPGELARWLFEFEANSLNRTTEAIVFQYVELLGETGLAVYRNRAEAEWRAARGTRGRYPTAKLARLDAVVGHAALLSVDATLMAEVSPGGLHHPWAYWWAAHECLEARQPDKALAWAELGLKAFSHEPYPGLRELLADEYARRGRMTEALNQAWALFTEGPSTKKYLRLRTLAHKARQVPVWRDEALEYLKERAARAPKDEPAGERLHCGSLIVDILLKEKNVDAAWSEVQIGGCEDETLLKLARAREAGHPADAIRVYQQFAERVVQGGGDYEYRAAVSVLRRAAEVITRLGQPKKFSEYLAGFRERNKRKKNLLWLLDREFGPQRRPAAD
jgi:uncharacterized Zn finger protein